MTNYSRPPTEQQIIDAFTDYSAGRADAGVVIAKSLAKVVFAEGQVTVFLDPAKAGAEYWALMETRAHENPADFFGSPVAADDKDGIWLRGRVSHVEVRDIDGRPLGARSTSELNNYATGRSQRADD